MIGTAADGRFTSNVQLLALCPILAVSDTVVNALGLGVAVLTIVALASTAMALVRRWFASESALAACVLLTAGITACVELLMDAWFHDLRQALGISLPLVVSNVVIISQIHAQHPIRGSLKLCLGIGLTLLALSVARELVGRGSLLHDAARMLGPWASQLEMKVFRVDMGFLLAMLPPGAFISLGLLMAARNWVAQKLEHS